MSYESLVLQVHCAFLPGVAAKGNIVVDAFSLLSFFPPSVALSRRLLRETPHVHSLALVHVLPSPPRWARHG